MWASRGPPRSNGGETGAKRLVLFGAGCVGVGIMCSAAWQGGICLYAGFLRGLGSELVMELLSCFVF